MTLPTPQLDDRTFQDILNEARKDLIPRYCPEWTDHNLSDPGMTLVELFAWMMETLLYRLNRVPEKSLITLLNLMGISLDPPQAACADITFIFTGSPTLLIPQGTEVATERTPTEEAISFRTVEDLRIEQPDPKHVWATAGRGQWIDPSKPMDPFPLFEKLPHADDKLSDVLYLGFTQDPSRLVIALDFDCATGEAGTVPPWPALQWEEYLGSDKMSGRKVDSAGPTYDAASGRAGIVLYLPAGLPESRWQGEKAYWIRGRVVERSEGPRIRRFRCAAIGGTVPARCETLIEKEELGRSNGQPGQVFRVSQPPILDPDRKTDFVEVESVGGQAPWERWEIRRHFGDLHEGSRRCVCDPVSGEIRFGPAIVQPDGTRRQYGEVPPEGARIRISYRSGGGAKGNARAETLIQNKSSLPGLLKVINRRAAAGGDDAETMEHAIMDAFRELRIPDRAVTKEDFVWLAVHTPKASIARALCVGPGDEQNAPPVGAVRLLLVPDVRHIERPTEEDLTVPPEVKKQVRGYLEERCLLGTRIDLGQPTYRVVIVNIRIKVHRQYKEEDVKKGVEAALHQFLHPVRGGREGKGWPFGETVYYADIYNVVQRIPGVESIEEADLRLRNEKEKRAGDDKYQIKLAADELIRSGQHVVSCEGSTTSADLEKEGVDRGTAA